MKNLKKKAMIAMLAIAFGCSTFGAADLAFGGFAKAEESSGATTGETAGGSENTEAGTETGAETETFSMKIGASVRKTAPTGIRFSVTIPAGVYNAYTNPVCGTLLAPADSLGEGETLSFDTAESADALDIPAVNWEEKQDGGEAYVYNGVLVGGSTESGETSDFPETFYNVKFVAVGYIYEAGENGEKSNVQYAANPQTRSLAYTASAALKKGEKSEYLADICDYVVGDGPAFEESGVAVIETIGETSEFALSGDKGLEAIWESSDEAVATVDENGVVTAVGKGKAKISATIGSKKAVRDVSVGAALDLKYDKATRTVSWNGEMPNATEYTLTVNGETRDFEGNSYELSDSDKPAAYPYDAVISVTTDTGKSDSITACMCGEESNFNQLKSSGEIYDEYYIADFHNAAAWGQFTKDGYTGGKENGVTFKYGNEVYDDWDNQTRISDGSLKLVTYRGWASSALYFVLPEALKSSEIKSITFKIKLESTSIVPVCYINDSIYVDVYKTFVTSSKDENGWTSCTIDIFKWNEAPETIFNIGITTSAAMKDDQTSWVHYIKEVTYQTHGKEIPENAKIVTDFFSGVTYSGNSSVSAVASNDSAIPQGATGKKLQSVNFGGAWFNGALAITFGAGVKFNPETTSFVIRAFTETLNNGARPYFMMYYNENTAGVKFQRQYSYAINKDNYAAAGLTLDSDGYITINKIKIGASNVMLRLWLDSAYLVDNSENYEIEGATQLLDVSASSTYALSGAWTASDVVEHYPNSLTTDEQGYNAWTVTCCYLYETQSKWGHKIDLATEFDMTNYENLYVRFGVSDISSASGIYVHITDGNKLYQIVATEVNKTKTYTVSKSALTAAGLDITKIKGLSLRMGTNSFYLGGIWAK